MSVDPLVITDLVRRALGGGMDWQPFRTGIDICRLHDIADGSSSALLRYAPGATVPRHVHTGYEHIYVLKGSQVDDRGTHRAGTLVINPPGSSHAVASPEGCLVLAVWEKTVAFV